MLVQNFDHCIEVSGETPDKVGVLANLESLINVSQDLSKPLCFSHHLSSPLFNTCRLIILSPLVSIAGDNANFVIMESGAKRILITSIDQYQLIVSCKASADYLQCKGYIQETLYLVFNSNLLQCLIPLSPVII